MFNATSRYHEAVQLIRSCTQHQPAIGLVLGSGLGGLANELKQADFIPYEDIPNCPRSTVHGHYGRLVIGTLEGQTVIAQQGRVHFYEGYDMQQVTFLVRVMGLLGVKVLILTNAAGGIDPNYKVGDLMLLNDHINLPGMAGHHPLIGPNDESLGERFVGMSQAYDYELRALAHQVAQANNLPLHEGVYAAVSGPSFETPAEVRFLRAIGANAVGMSTVHEVLVARHMRLRVMAISGITNVAIDQVDSDNDASHEEVLEAGALLVPRLTTLLRGVLQAIG
ncbi:MAG: purine-nucleoside phosphorylase [Anaerolineae bacterium]|nr:purine-nucleoside phosphorylase [Anaerolineae bacterium]MDW8171369.1 purine-nucleoside phosphorylase [Anaerolineae bacterium]